MRTLTRLVLAAVALGLLAGAQGQDRPEAQLKAAIYKETVEADLQGAITLYKQIVSNGAAPRPVAAAALLGLGGCYEKLGQRDARTVYERLVAEYPDQAQEATQARERLAAMSRAVPASSREPRFRKVVMTGLGYADAQLSPDGEEIAFTDSGAVWVVPVATGTDPIRTGIPAKLTGPLDARGIGWSPDGRSIAFNTPTGISLITRSGGVPTEVIKVPVGTNDRRLRTISVSSDGTRLAYSRGASLGASRVYLAGTGGGTPAELPGAAGTSMPAFSPDGKRLAYVHISKSERPPGTGSMPTIEGEIWIAAADGANPVMASRLPGWPEGPVWSPDGSMIAFLQRAGVKAAGNPELMVLTVTAEGSPAGAPARITVPFETYRLLAGWTADNKIGLLRYNPEQQNIYRVPATGGRAAQISAKGYASHPRWSRDGKRIYLRWNRGQIGWMPAEGGEVTVIPVNTAVMEAEALPGGGNAASPDNTAIVFSGGHKSHSDANALYTNIWTVGIKGGQPKQLTSFTDPDTRFPCWSPDGRRVAFIARDTTGKQTGSSEKPGSLVFQVYVVSSDGTGLRQVTSEAHRVDWSAVAWSPDGRSIAFFSRDKTLSLIPAEGGDARVVADLRRIDSLLVSGLGGLAFSEVAWSPDGKELAFSFDGRLWRVGAGGGAVTEVRTGLTGVHAIYLDWSPDGRTIAFTGSEGGDEDLWLMEDFIPLVKAPRGAPARAGASRLTIRRVPDLDMYARPSPDGKYLAFTDWESGNLAIRDVATGVTRALTKDGDLGDKDQFAEFSAWARNSRRIAYQWNVDDVTGSRSELRVISLDGNMAPETIAIEGARWIEPLDWSPDGSRILCAYGTTARETKHALVGVGRGAADKQDVPAGDWLAHFMPDGDAMLYSASADGKAGPRDIFLRNLKTGVSTPIVQHPAEDLLVGVLPGTEWLFFASDRRGRLDLWAVPFRQDKADGQPVLVKQGLGRLFPLGFTNDGRYYYATLSATDDVFFADFDRESGRVTSEARRFTSRWDGVSAFPSYSPDGASLAYVVKRGPSPVPIHAADSLVVQSLQSPTAEPAVVGFGEFGIEHVMGPCWLADGTAIVLGGYGPRQEDPGLYRVDLPGLRKTKIYAVTGGRRLAGHECASGRASIYVVLTTPASGQGAEASGEVIRIDAAGGSEVEVFRAPRGQGISSIALAPDGRTLSIITRLDRNRRALLLMPAEGGTPRQVHQFREPSGGGGAQVWAPDGRSILYVQMSDSWKEDQTFFLRSVQADGGPAGPQTVFEWTGQFFGLRFHPNGRVLAFTGRPNTSTSSEVWVIENLREELKVLGGGKVR